jgi:DNA-binding NarL/FixJ family response regulator
VRHGHTIGRVAIRTLVVEDDPDMRRLLRVALRFAPDLRLVGEAADTEIAVALAETHQPDVICLDLYLPGETPRRAFQRIRAASPRSRIVVFTAHASAREWVVAEGTAFLRKEDGVTYLVQALAG